MKFNVQYMVKAELVLRMDWPEIEDWGAILIKDALKEQDRYWERRVRGEISDTIIFAEHEPVYTAGARAKNQPRLLENCFKVPLSELPCPIVITNRGGLVTYQGPGILSVYCVFGMKNLSIPDFEKTLLDSADAFLKTCGVAARQKYDNPGLYIGKDKKIASVGLQIFRGITRYGMTISLCPDKKYLEPLIPCGLENMRMTSLAEELDIKSFSENEKSEMKRQLAGEISSRWL